MYAMMTDFVHECGGSVSISKKQYERSISKYEKLFNPHYNSFVEMIRNRWATIYIRRKLFAKLRFTYNPTVDVIPNTLNRHISCIVFLTLIIIDLRVV